MLTLVATMVSFVCFVAGTRELRIKNGSRTGAWWVFSALLFGVALAHAWNLGSTAAESGREVFRFEGLYGVRRPIQALVILVLMGVTAAALWFGGPFVRRRLGREFELPAVVLLGLFGYLAVRTISLHQVDSWLYGKHIFAAHPGTLIELGGLLLFLYVALRTADGRTVDDRGTARTSTSPVARREG